MREMYKFKYTNTIANQFNYRGAFDFHNTKRRDGRTKYGFSIEDT